MKKVTKRMLDALKVEFNDHPNITEINIPQDEWEVDHPYVWYIAEEKHGFTLCLDTGYGQMALFEEGKKGVVGKGHYLIVHDDVVALDKDSYGTKQYLWFK